MICAIVLPGILTWAIVAYQGNEKACAHALVVRQCEHAHHSVSKPRKRPSHLLGHVLSAFSESLFNSEHSDSIFFQRSKSELGASH